MTDFGVKSLAEAVIVRYCKDVNMENNRKRKKQTKKESEEISLKLYLEILGINISESYVIQHGAKIYKKYKVR